jgi:hypothetical protein
VNGGHGFRKEGPPSFAQLEANLLRCFCHQAIERDLKLAVVVLVLHAIVGFRADPQTAASVESYPFCPYSRQTDFSTAFACKLCYI